MNCVKFVNLSVLNLRFSDVKNMQKIRKFKES